MQDIIVIGVIVLAVIIACICMHKDKKKCKKCCGCPYESTCKEKKF